MLTFGVGIARSPLFPHRLATPFVEASDGRLTRLGITVTVDQLDVKPLTVEDWRRCQAELDVELAKSIAQIELAQNQEKYENKVYTIPKHLDKKVARLHLEKLGVKLTTLSQEQADYIGVAVEGPYKPEYYRY